MSGKRTLSVSVVKARDLAAKDSSGKSDPYVKVKVDGIKKKTKTVKQNLNPEWHETFYFDDVDERCAVKLVMYDWDLVGGHDFMGEVFIPSSDVADAGKGTVEKWYPLQRRKAKDVITGDVYVKLALMEKPSATFDPKAAMAQMGAAPHPSAPTEPIHVGGAAAPLPPTGAPAPPPPPPPGAAPPPPSHAPAPPPPPPPGPAHPAPYGGAAPPPPPGNGPPSHMPHPPVGGGGGPMPPSGPPPPPHGGLPPMLPKRALPAAPSMVTHQPGGLHASHQNNPAPGPAPFHPQPQPPMQQPPQPPMQQPPQPPQPQIHHTPSFSHPPPDTPPQPPRSLPQPPPAPVAAPRLPQARVEYDFEAMNPNEITAYAGEVMTLLGENGDWTELQAADGRKGWIASNYVTKL